MTTPAQRGLKGPPSPRQNEVLLLVGQGLTNIEIGDRLGIGDRTVKQHCEKLKAKFGVKKKRDLVPIAQMNQGQRDILIAEIQSQPMEATA